LAAARVATLNQNTTGSSGSCTGASGSTTGNAATVTNGVYTTGTQTIGGAKTFSSNVTAPDFIATSDERLKDIIEPISGALDKVCAIDGFIYKWNNKAPSKDTVTRQVGVSAQDVQAVLPEIVEEGADGFLQLSYDRLIPLLVESIKELRAEVEELKIINSNEGQS